MIKVVAPRAPDKYAAEIHFAFLVTPPHPTGMLQGSSG